MAKSVQIDLEGLLIHYPFLYTQTVSSECLGTMWGYIIKETVRACIEDLKLEGVGGFNLKELWAIPREGTVLAFFIPVLTGMRISILETHGEKCERREKHTY